MRNPVTTVLVGALLCTGCDDSRFMDTELVQSSADADPRWRIDINRVINGVYRSYFPRCTDDVRLGHTVEFRNFLPDVPANVTSIAAPTGAALYSPNIMHPYNYVAADDPDNGVCSDGVCQPYSYWRATFSVAGTYDWMDTNQGDPGRRIVDAYYGTVTFIGIDPNTPVATICVPDAEGQGCQGVCCTSDGDCAGSNVCTKSTFEAVGRCQLPTD